jgi:glycosyltransferase involved in cell wall biosynthesis
MNEEKNLPYVFSRLPEGLHEVILVDGHSVDETVAVARRLRPDIRILTQSGRGKGNAMAEGFAACTGEIIVALDADGSTDPAEIPRFVSALCNGADFVKGSRFAQGGLSTDITRARSLGNRLLGAFVNTLYGTHYTDLCYGYNAFWTRCLPYLRVDCDGFEVETLINVRVAKAGLIVHEVPSFEQVRLHGESNLNTVRDGTRVLRTIVRERLAMASETSLLPRLAYRLLGS